MFCPFHSFESYSVFFVSTNKKVSFIFLEGVNMDNIHWIYDERAIFVLT